MKNKIENLDDIIFENRNQEYGAYDLRKKYSKRGSVALAVSLFILFVTVGAPLIASILNQRNYDKNLGDITEIVLEDLNTPKDEEIAPPPTPPAPEPPKDMIKFTAPKIVDTLSEPDVIIATVDDLIKIGNTGVKDTAEEQVDLVIVDDIEDLTNTKTYFEPYQIEEQPTFPGGEAELLKYISQNIVYPHEAQENGIEGVVYVRFVVTSTGSVAEVQTLRDYDELLDKEALRVVKSLPRWNPGKQNGNAVSVWFTIPIKFVLQ